MNPTDADLAAIWLTLKLASLTTVILLVLGTPLALWLASTASRWRAPVAALVALPLVLPPTVLGFYLLMAFSPDSPPAQVLNWLGWQNLPFSFSGLVFASVLYSLPFVVQPIQAAIAGVGRQPLEIAASLGAGPVDRFFTVLLPLAKMGLLNASVLGFAHTVGEFGVVLMIGGNIPELTQVISIRIYEHVEATDYQRAHFLSFLLLGFSFMALWVVYGSNNRHAARVL